MPIYDFGCDRCGKEKETLQSFSSKPPVCCGEPMVHLPTSPAKIEIKDKGGIRVHTKGYKDDYAKDYRRRLADRRGAEVLS